jgi:hypothetical protein
VTSPVSKNGGDGGTGVYMREGTTSKLMTANRPYGEFYDFYSVSSKYFEYILINSRSNNNNNNNNNNDRTDGTII